MKKIILRITFIISMLYIASFAATLIILFIHKYYINQIIGSLISEFLFTPLIIFLTFWCFESLYNIVKNKEVKHPKKNNKSDFEDSSQKKRRRIAMHIAGGIVLAYFSIYLCTLYIGDSAAIISQKYAETEGIVYNLHYENTKGGGCYHCDVNGIDFSVPDNFKEGTAVKIKYLPKSKVMLDYKFED